MDALNHQHGGDHYKGLAIEPADYCQQNGLKYMESSAIKYLTRHHLKGGAVDLKKAIHFCQMALEAGYGVHCDITFDTDINEWDGPCLPCEEQALQRAAAGVLNTTPPPEYVASREPGPFTIPADDPSLINTTAPAYDGPSTWVRPEPAPSGGYGGDVRPRPPSWADVAVPCEGLEEFRAIYDPATRQWTMPPTGNARTTPPPPGDLKPARMGPLEDDIPRGKTSGTGRWEAVAAFEGMNIIGYRVRWSVPSPLGRFLWVGHYLAGGNGVGLTLGWCESASETDAKEKNKAGKRPVDYRAWQQTHGIKMAGTHGPAGGLDGDTA